MNDKHLLVLQDFFVLHMDDSLDAVLNLDRWPVIMVLFLPDHGGWKVIRQVKLKWNGVVSRLEWALESESCHLAVHILVPVSSFDSIATLSPIVTIVLPPAGLLVTFNADFQVTRVHDLLSSNVDLA